MTSFIVLTPPQGPDRDHASTRFVADRFTWLGFLFPALWLLIGSCWLAGIATLLAQGFAAWLGEQPGLFWAGALMQFGIALLIGLEGRHIRVTALVRRGWMLSDIVTAPDLATAETIYFSSLPAEAPKPFVPVTDWNKLSPPAQRSAQGFAHGGPALGLFDIGGGR